MPSSSSHQNTHVHTSKTTQDSVDEQTPHGEALLRSMDTQVKLAMQAQIGVASTVDSILGVLYMFRGPLAAIPLPPPSAVEAEQALKVLPTYLPTYLSTCLPYLPT